MLVVCDSGLFQLFVILRVRKEKESYQIAQGSFIGILLQSIGQATEGGKWML
jgi:hypothetical protein